MVGASKSGFGASAKPASGKSSSKEKKKYGPIRRSAQQQPLIQAPRDLQALQIETAYAHSLTFLVLLKVAKMINFFTTFKGKKCHYFSNDKF